MVSYKWIAQVLRQRGIPCPDLAIMQAAVNDLDAQNQERLLQGVQSIERGTESEDTLAWVRSTIAKPVEASKVVVTPVSPARKTVAPTYGKKTATASKDLPLLHPISSTIPTTDGTDEVPQDTVAPKGLDKESRVRKYHRVYASKAALKIEMDVLREPLEDGSPAYTVLLEIAPAAGARNFDWEHKIVFQFMRRELPVLACGLLGMLESPLHLTNHGKNANKSFRMEDQGDKLFVKIGEASRVLVIPVEPIDAFEWTQIALTALALNGGERDPLVTMAMLKRLAAMTNFKTDHK